MENLEIYEKIKEVPKEARKKITGGRLVGMTDIKPMWRIEKLTEIFGPVGLGWYAPVIKREIIEGANNEKIAVVDINLFVNYKTPYKLDDDLWSEPIYGTGGSSFIAKEKNGLYTSDECFKMAYTDALSVACKMLGMGASVYWGDSKYDTSKKIETEEEARNLQITFGKYNGKTIGEIYEAGDIKYLEWLFDKSNDENIKKAVSILTGLVEKTPEESKKEINAMPIQETQKQRIKDLPIEKEQIKKYLTKLNKSKISELTYGEANELLKKAEGSIRAEIAWYEQEVEG